MAHAAAVFAVTEPVVAALLWRAKELALVVGVTNVVFVAVTLSCFIVALAMTVALGFARALEVAQLATPALVAVTVSRQ